MYVCTLCDAWISYVSLGAGTQEYEGRHCDVTITPWKGGENMLSSFAKMLKNVNTDEFRVMTIVGVLVSFVAVAVVSCPVLSCPS